MKKSRLAKMASISRGFTLIELVLVIVILGVLAAVALPQFVDLSKEARRSQAQTYAAAIVTATAQNYVARMAGSPSAVPIYGSNMIADPLATLSPLLEGVPASGKVLTDDLAISLTSNCSGVESGFLLVFLIRDTKNGNAILANGRLTCVK